jgi:hypothetical protein
MYWKLTKNLLVLAAGAVLENCLGVLLVQFDIDMELAHPWLLPIGFLFDCNWHFAALEQ